MIHQLVDKNNRVLIECYVETHNMRTSINIFAYSELLISINNPDSIIEVFNEIYNLEQTYYNHEDYYDYNKANFYVSKVYDGAEQSQNNFRHIVKKDIVI